MPLDNPPHETEKMAMEEATAMIPDDLEIGFLKNISDFFNLVTTISSYCILRTNRCMSDHLR